MIFIDGGGGRPLTREPVMRRFFNSGASPDTGILWLYTGFYLIENLNGPWGGKKPDVSFLRE